MSRMLGTVSMGIRAPIIRKGDNLVEIVTGSILEAMKEDGLAPRNRDVVAMTEAIVARAQGNYVTVEQIATDIRTKLGGETVGVIFPILSRNRFSICLRGIAKGCKGIATRSHCRTTHCRNTSIWGMIIEHLCRHLYRDKSKNEQ